MRTLLVPAGGADLTERARLGVKVVLLDVDGTFT